MVSAVCPIQSHCVLLVASGSLALHGLVILVELGLLDQHVEVAISVLVFSELAFTEDASGHHLLVKVHLCWQTVLSRTVDGSLSGFV